MDEVHEWAIIGPKTRKASVWKEAPIAAGDYEVLIIGDSVIKDIRKYLPPEYKVFSYDNATISDVCAHVKEAAASNHVSQVVLHAGTFDLKADNLKIKYADAANASYSAQDEFQDDFCKIKTDMQELLRFGHEKFPLATIFVSALLQRNGINSKVIQGVNLKLERFVQEITRDLQGVFDCMFFDGIGPNGCPKNGVQLPHEMSQVFANNLTDFLVIFRPLKLTGLMKPIEAAFEPDINVAWAKRIVIGDCLLEDICRFMSNCKVFWFKKGTVEKLKEKVIAVPRAFHVEGVVLHVGAFEKNSVVEDLDETMDQVIELLLICFDRFPKAKILLSPILPSLDPSVQAKAHVINEFYHSLKTVFGGKFDIIQVDYAIIRLCRYEQDGIHLGNNQARIFANQITNALEAHKM